MVFFQRVDGVVDVSPVNSDHMHIIFDVTEVSPLFADLRATTGDNEAKITGKVSNNLDSSANILT